MSNVTNYEYTFYETFWWNFYVVDRSKTTFEHPHEVPNLIPQVK